MSSSASHPSPPGTPTQTRPLRPSPLQPETVTSPTKRTHDNLGDDDSGDNDTYGREDLFQTNGPKRRLLMKNVQTRGGLEELRAVCRAPSPAKNLSDVKQLILNHDIYIDQMSQQQTQLLQAQKRMEESQNDERAVQQQFRDKALERNAELRSLINATNTAEVQTNDRREHDENMKKWMNEQVKACVDQTTNSVRLLVEDLEKRNQAAGQQSIGRELQEARELLEAYSKSMKEQVDAQVAAHLGSSATSGAPSVNGAGGTAATSSVANVNGAGSTAATSSVANVNGAGSMAPTSSAANVNGARGGTAAVGPAADGNGTNSPNEMDIDSGTGGSQPVGSDNRRFVFTMEDFARPSVQPTLSSLPAPPRQVDESIKQAGLKKQQLSFVPGDEPITSKQLSEMLNAFLNPPDGAAKPRKIPGAGRPGKRAKSIHKGKKNEWEEAVDREKDALPKRKKEEYDKAADQLFKRVFRVEKMRGFMFHKEAPPSEVKAFRNGDQGSGPDPQNLRWEMDGTRTTKWNIRVIDSLTDMMLVESATPDVEMGSEGDNDTEKPHVPSAQYWRLLFRKKFERARTWWRRSVPRLLPNGQLETRVQVKARIQKTLADEERAERHRSRRARKWSDRNRIVTGKISIAKNRSDKNAEEVWEWLQTVLEWLGTDGMSSEDTEDDDISTIYRVKIVYWRREMVPYLELIDQGRLDPDIYDARGKGKVARIRTPNGKDMKTTRKPQVGLPAALYDESFIEKASESITLSMSKEAFNWLNINHCLSAVRAK